MKSLAATAYEQSRQLAAEGDWEAALEKSKLCLSEQPENKKYKKLFQEITLHQTVIRQLQQGKELEESGHFKQAIKIYRSGLKTKTSFHKQIKDLIKQTQKNQEKFEEFYKQAQKLCKQEKYTKAKVIIQHLLKTTPQNQAICGFLEEMNNREQAHIFYSEAMALYKQTRYQKALKKLAHSLQLYPDFTGAHILMAKIGTEMTSHKYQLDEDWKNKKTLHEAISLLEGSADE